MTNADRSDSDLFEFVHRIDPHTAAFDCDGTLWIGDAGEEFLRWELKQRVLAPRPADELRTGYQRYLRGEVPEAAFWGFAVSVHQGLRESDLRSAAQRFIAADFTGRKLLTMLSLVRELLGLGRDVRLISATNQWVIEAAADEIGVARENVLAAKARVEDGVITSELERVPSGDAKVEILRAAGIQTLHMAFGNSIFDQEMLAFARQPVVIHPNDDLRALAVARGWPIFYPE